SEVDLTWEACGGGSLGPATYYPKPIIFLSPTGEVALGGAVTVQCWGWHQNMRFRLYKDGNPTALQDAEPAGDLAEFPIRNVSRRDAGSYSCSYQDKLYLFNWSHPSDPVELVVAGREFLKPTISVSPSRVVALGGSVTIRCQGWHPGRTFLLHKVGHLNLQNRTVPDGTVAEFPIPSVGREAGGNYTCDYHSIAEPNRWSGLSDPVEIIVTGEGPGSVSRLPAPHPARPSGGLCTDGMVRARFSLFKVGDRTPLGRAEPAGAGGEFLTRSVRRGDGGSYTCYYHYATDPCTWSEPSDPVELVVAGEGTGSVSEPHAYPSRVVALGGSVTIRCGGRYRSMEFFLRKAGHPNPQVQTVPDGTVAEFPIPSVGREDGGSYTCEYHPITEQNRWSYPSNPVEIIVAGEGPGSVSRLPAPHPARPSGGLWETWPGSGDGVTGGIPSQRGAAAAGDLGQRKGGSMPPGGAAEQRARQHISYGLMGGDKDYKPQRIVESCTVPHKTVVVLCTEPRSPGSQFPLL
uniref:Ig-like domain-containing protein n=1 Tax=Chelydra serpentina TaxID=8475 RepID=A0A8C3SSF3_CHESE